MYKKLFLMALPRSGSTLLGQVMAGHSRIYHLGESMYWELLNPKYNRCSCGKINCRFLNKIYKNFKDKHLGQPLLKAWQIIDKKYWPGKKISVDSVIQNQKQKINPKSLNYWIKRCPNALEKIINIYEKYTKKDIFLDNTKLHLIGKLLSLRNDWGIIILLRDPRGIMLSYRNAGIRKKDFRKAESVLPYCYEFIKSVFNIKNRRNVFIIKYEDFCLKTSKIVKEMCNFIGVFYEPLMTNFNVLGMNKRGHVLKGNRLLYNKINSIKPDENWKQDLTDQELKNLYRHKKLIKLYREFKYFNDYD